MKERHDFEIVDLDGDEHEFNCVTQDNGDVWVYGQTADDPLGFDVLLDFKATHSRGMYERFHVHEKDSHLVHHFENTPVGWVIYKAPLVTRISLPVTIGMDTLPAIELYVRHWIQQFPLFAPQSAVSHG